MGLFSRFEDKAENVIEGGGRGGIEPVKLEKRAAKEMQREKMIGVGHEYAPTLYNVLVSVEDDRKMGGYYPSIAGEIETFLLGRANAANLVFDCRPLVRFIVDPGLKRGKFDIIAENVSPAIIEELRREETEHYGLDSRIDIDPVLRHSTSPADAEDLDQVEFDPFLPSDMQSAHYIPEDSPARHASDPLPEPDPEPAEEPEDASAAETVLFSGSTIPNGARVCLYDYDRDHRYPLSGSSVSFGRGTDNGIVISDPGASRHHGELTFDGTAWMVRDLGSTNGTYINGEPITQHYLNSGDVVEIGTTRLEFQEG